MKNVITMDPVLKNFLAAREMLWAQGGTAKRQFEPSPVPETTAAERAAKAKVLKGEASGFARFGDFLAAVVKAATGEIDPRLTRAPTGAGEVDPSGGGFLVPTEYTQTLIGSIYEEAVLAPLCDRREVAVPEDVRIPAIDEKSRADGSRWGGAVSYWLNEGDTVPGSLPRYREITFAAKKLIALVTATGELFRDVGLLENHVSRAYAAEAAFRIDYGILRGPGGGQLLGITNAPGTITVPKANGQASGTILAENIRTMWQRFPAPCRKRGIWAVNEDVEAQLDVIGASGGSAGAAGMYFPAGANGNAFPLLFGRPVVVVEQAPTLGTPGDIALLDLSQYLIVERKMKTDLSLDVQFNSDQVVFRFVWRGDGKPVWTTPITPFNGGATRSPYVILAQR